MTCQEDPPICVADILKRAVPGAADLLSPRAADTLVRMEMCRTEPLGQRDYRCEGSCESSAVVFNSCGERHCCRCSGYYRVRWLENMRAQLVPQTQYLQIVFTVPDTIGELFQYAPAAAYSMLMQTAAREVKKLQRRLGVTSGSIVVLHTWNQQMLHHAHVHVLIPVAGIGYHAAAQRGTQPEVDAADQWVSIADRLELKQGDQFELGAAFRKSIIRRIKRLQKHDKLTFTGKYEHLNEPAVLCEYLDEIAPTGYRVFVQHAPGGCEDPATVVKYLARYVSGGPISDRRIVSAEDGNVSFMVRDNNSAAPGERKKQVAETIPETEFVRRWSLHILPKGFVRVRGYGHASPSCRTEYLQRCRNVLGIETADGEATDGKPSADEASADEPTAEEPLLEADEFPEVFEEDEDDDGDAFHGVSMNCPKCGKRMKCVSFSYRPSWSDTMSSAARPGWYES